MSIKETYLGKTALVQEVKKKLGLVIKNDAITTDKIKDGSITTNKIADSAVTTDKVGNNAINESKIAANAVTTSKIKDDSITSDKIVNGAVTNDKITATAITGDKIMPGSITSDKYDKDSIISWAICDGAITEEKIRNGAVTTDKIKNGNITNSKICDTSITSNKIADNAVITPVIANKAVTEAKLADSAVSERCIINKSITVDKLSDSLKETITKVVESSSKQRQIICMYNCDSVPSDIFDGAYIQEFGDLSEVLKIGDYAFKSNEGIYICKDPTEYTEWEKVDLTKIPKDTIFLSTYFIDDCLLNNPTYDFTPYIVRQYNNEFKLIPLHDRIVSYNGNNSDVVQLFSRINNKALEVLYPKIVPNSITNNSIKENKLSEEVQDKLNFYDCIPSNEEIFNPIYRINSEWYNNNYKNQGTINCTLNSNWNFQKINEGVGIKVPASSSGYYTSIVSNMAISLTRDNYKEGMTYLNYCTIGSMPIDDVELITSTSMQNSTDNRYHVLVWEKTGLARADWKINGSWSGSYYTDNEGADVQLSDADLNKAFLVTADCAHKKFILYSFDGKTVEKRGTVTLPANFTWQGYTDGANRRQIGLGQAVFGGNHKDSTLYESMIWNKVLYEDEVNTVFNKLKYYSD